MLLCGVDRGRPTPFPDFNFLDSFKLNKTILFEALNNCRLIKSEGERGLMGAVCESSSDSFRNLQSQIKPGMYEFQICSIFEIFGRQNENHSYNPIFGTGMNGATLHYVDNGAVTKRGELILVDASFQKDGYCSDITRTFPVSGKFSEE